MAVSSDEWDLNFASEALKKDNELIQIKDNSDFPF
jgi:hypothetical protein